jgi:flavorubredoxin
MGWYNVPVDHLSVWDNDILKTGKRQFKFIMTPHVHHWDSMMIFEENTKSLFTSDLFIQPGNNKPSISEDMSESMINLYRSAGIFATEKLVGNITKRLENLSPIMVYPMHGSCIDNSLFSKYTEDIMKNDFAYSGILLGQKLDTTIS